MVVQIVVTGNIAPLTGVYYENTVTKIFRIMKTTLLILGVMVFLASTSRSDLRFTVSMQGLEGKDILKEGVNAAQLTRLIVRAMDEKIIVEELDITHARGKSAVNKASVRGDNTFDLKDFRSQAKRGDRIIVEIRKVRGANAAVLDKENSILQIPIL